MELNFTFSDTISGYVSDYDQQKRMFNIRTSDNRVFKAYLADTCYARYAQNPE
jgi:hypothetical protein